MSNKHPKFESDEEMVAYIQSRATKQQFEETKEKAKNNVVEFLLQKKKEFDEEEKGG